MAESSFETLTRYAISIDAWDHFYSYIAEPLSREEIGESVHLETLDFRGKVVFPRRYKGIRSIIMIESEKISPQGSEPVPERPVIENLAFKKKLLDVYVRIPTAHFGRILMTACADRTKVVSFGAARMYKRRALIRSINISTKLNENDL